MDQPAGLNAESLIVTTPLDLAEPIEDRRLDIRDGPRDPVLAEAPDQQTQIGSDRIRMSRSAFGMASGMRRFRFVQRKKMRWRAEPTRNSRAGT
jgi:hypothetical protein